MDDAQIVQRIRELADEEHALEQTHAGKGLSGDELEYRKLRTLLYKVGGALPDGSDVDDLARLVLDSVSGKDFRGGS